MRFIFIFISLSFFARLFGGTLFLINDSPFPLTAVVQSQAGMFLGQQFLQPGEQRNSVTDLNASQLRTPGYANNIVLTPYTVIWKCTNGGYYSICTNVSPGELVKASLCPGTYYCHPKPKSKKKSHGKGGCCCTPSDE